MFKPCALSSGVLPAWRERRCASRRPAASGCRWAAATATSACAASRVAARTRDKYQSTTPRKRHRTGLFDTPLEAAVAFAQLREDLDLGIHVERSQKKPQPPASDDTSKKKDVGVYLGRLLQLPRADVLCVWAVLLSQQQAAAAVARGVAVAYAEVLA